MHAGQHSLTLTLLTTSLGAPVYVDGAREDAKQNQKSIVQKLASITNAAKDIKLPSATPGIHMLISSLSEIAVKAIVTLDVPVPFREDISETALSQLSSNQLPKTLPKDQLANEKEEMLTNTSEQVGESASTQGPEPRPTNEPPALTQKAEKSMPAPITSPDPGSFLKSDRLPNGNSVSLPTPPSPPSSSPVCKIRIGSSTFEVRHQSKSGLIIGSQTLLPGDVVTIQNVPISISYPPFAPTLAIGGHTTTLPSLATSTPNPRPQIITLASETFLVSQLSPATIVIDSQTLTPGGVITANGRPVSLLSAKNAFIVGDRTLALPPLPTASASASAFADDDDDDDNDLSVFAATMTRSAASAAVKTDEQTPTPTISSNSSTSRDANTRTATTRRATGNGEGGLTNTGNSNTETNSLSSSASNGKNRLTLMMMMTIMMVVELHSFA